MENELPSKKSNCLHWVIIGTLISLGILLLAGLLVYIFWYRPTADNPISEPISLPTPLPTSVNNIDENPIKPSNLQQAPVFIPPTMMPDVKPVCGEEAEWLVLVVGVDYRGEGYLYGLADAIRVARVDFTDMTVDMVSLPRDLIVEAPEGRFTVPDPFKINQAYLFGTPGMAHYVGSGGGAGALAEIIRYNFGINVNHYGVVNFETFAKIIDAIGGVEIDLPTAISDEKYGGFPAGKQTLTGERALSLARIRKDYGDDFRVNNQTLIMRGIINRVLTPAVLIKIPGLLEQFKGTFLTDLSMEQLGTIGICFLNNFDGDNLHILQTPKEVLTSDSAFIPSLNDNAFVYRWDQKLVEWVYKSLMGE